MFFVEQKIGDMKLNSILTISKKKVFIAQKWRVLLESKLILSPAILEEDVNVVALNEQRYFGKVRILKH